MFNSSLTANEKTNLLELLQKRFESNMHRHPKLDWAIVEERLNTSESTLLTVHRMEQTAGEPDVIAFDTETIVYIDCSIESPKARRSLCYDQAALDSRKEHKPTGNVLDTATTIGITLLNESQYKILQAYEPIDLKTSSWLLTPDDIRTKKGAIFGDRRYDHVFIYHNGADSYYAARGFRGFITI